MRDFLSLPGGLKKGLLIGVFTGAAVSLVVLLTVLLFRLPGKGRPPPELPELMAPQPPELSVYDFAIPDGVGDFLAPQPAYIRETRESWSPEDIEEFWEDPREAALEYLSEKNRLLRDQIFRGVP